LRHIASRRGLGPNGYRGSFPEPKRSGHEINHPPLSSAEIKTGWSYTSTPATRLLGVVRDNFTVASLHERQYFLANLYIPVCTGTGTHRYRYVQVQVYTGTSMHRYRYVQVPVFTCTSIYMHPMYMYRYVLVLVAHQYLPPM
jgi:hypothetical protein